VHSLPANTTLIAREDVWIEGWGEEPDWQAVLDSGRRPAGRRPRHGTIGGCLHFRGSSRVSQVVDRALRYAEHPDADKATGPIVASLGAVGVAQRMATLRPLVTVKR